MCPAHALFGSHCAVAYPQQPAALPQCVAGLLAAWGATLQCDACTPPTGAPRACQCSGHCLLGTRVLPHSGEFEDPVIRICHRAIFHTHFSPVFSTLSPTHSFISFTISLLSLFSTLLSCYQLAIRLTTLMNSYDLMTIPIILFSFFIHTLSFYEMRT